MPLTTRERFDAKWRVDPTTGCWRWTASISRGGYGEFQVVGIGSKRAHRHSWLLYRGQIPRGLIVCHTCDVRDCVNPDHLFLGTWKDNHSDMMAKGRKYSNNRVKTHCAHGHPYSGENVRYVERPNGVRWRVCRQCTREKDRRLRPTSRRTLLRIAARSGRKEADNG